MTEGAMTAGTTMGGTANGATAGLDIIKAIITEQKLNAIQPHEIGDDDDLLRGPVGLDSLDCLNVLLALEQRFALRLETARIDGETFRSVRSLAELVEHTRP